MGFDVAGSGGDVGRNLLDNSMTPQVRHSERSEESQRRDPSASPQDDGNFSRKILSSAGSVLRKDKIEVLQVNLGKLCNLSCVHCHVEAGPSRVEENMDEKTVEAVLRFLEKSKIKTLDLTGGAPEMNPHFRWLVKEARSLGVHVIDRCNLTVFYVQGQEDLPEFLKEHEVEIIASLPCYSKENVDKQRGDGTFDESIHALLKLNQLGYGRVGAYACPPSLWRGNTPLRLNLVYNPVGPHLPPPQSELEKDYKKRLREDFGIVFNRLYTITNMPIKRYAKYLKAFGQLENYEELLIESFNPATLNGLMCRNTLSVSWDGKIYDCDFNQMLGMQMRNGKPLTIFDTPPDAVTNFKILTADHCFGCTAGCGSSCQGALS
jgi:radical SAM/Cys-rich protein